MFKHWSKRTKVIGGVVVGVLAIVLAGGIYGVLTGKISVRADSGAVSGKVTSSAGCQVSGISVYTEFLGNTLFDRSTNTDAYGNFSFSGVPYNHQFTVKGGGGCKTIGWGSCMGSADGYFKLTPTSSVRVGHRSSLWGF